MAQLPVELAASPSELGVMQIVRSHSLTAYDAAYLDLAVRRDLPLATYSKNVDLRLWISEADQDNSHCEQKGQADETEKRTVTENVNENIAH